MAADREFATPAEHADRVAAQRRSDPLLVDEANFVAEGLEAVQAGAIPLASFMATFEGNVLAAAVATWGGTDPRSQALGALIKEWLEEDAGWTLTADGWVDNRAVGQHAGCFLRGQTTETSRPVYLVETVPGDDTRLRQLLVPPPVAGDTTRGKA